MRATLLLLLTIILFQTHGYCQTNAKITDVDFYLDGSNIIVNYNISGSLPKEHMTIELRFMTENNEIIIPKTVTGDVGTRLFGDGMKTIQWDIVADKAVLSGNIKASVTIKSSKILYGGPSNAFLSVVVPGLGGYFVEPNKTRAVITTISTLGLLGYGISQKHKANDYYDQYNASDIPSEIESLYNQANEANHKFYIATGIAAGIWAFDIIWVAVKGFQNQDETKSYYRAFTNDGLRLNYVNNGLQLRYSVSF